MDSIKKKNEGYKLYLITFIVLAALTCFAVWLTHVIITSPLAVGFIMLIAAIQAVIVLFYNMHLKFHDKILTIFVGLIFSIILLMIVITMLDFVYR
jgi:caa(3)-type oxidase subunit IV